MNATHSHSDRKRKRIAVWQPFFQGGGAEAVALWILGALHKKYDVTLYTLSDVDLTRLNKMYLTELSPQDITVKAQLSEAQGRWAYRLIANNLVVHMASIYWTIQRFKRESAQYDVVMSAFNGVDLGRPGIQYLHWAKVVENNSDKAEPWLKALMKWVDFSYENLCQSRSVANSQYTAERVRKTYGIEADVLFPPVVTEVPAVPWQNKENAFLCSGRIVKPKQTHRAITILKAVRKRGFDVQLHITGGGGGVYSSSYLRQVKAMARENADWVHLHQGLSYADYLQLISKCRYGLHYKPEPFGISVAEMLKADMIPFVRNFGGQMEIVGPEQQDILFADQADAIKKISHVLGDSDLQTNLLQALAPRKALFSTERFIDEIQSLVDRYVQDADGLSSNAAGTDALPADASPLPTA